MDLALQEHTSLEATGTMESQYQMLLEEHSTLHAENDQLGASKMVKTFSYL